MSSINWTEASKAGTDAAEKNILDAAGRLTNAIDQWEYDPSITPTGAVNGLNFLADLAEDRPKLVAFMTGQTAPSSAPALGAGSSGSSQPNPAEADLAEVLQFIKDWVPTLPGNISVKLVNGDPSKIDYKATLRDVKSSVEQAIKDAGTKPAPTAPAGAPAASDPDKEKKLKEASAKIAEGAKAITKGLSGTKITSDGAKKVQEGSKELADLVK